MNSAEMIDRVLAGESPQDVLDEVWGAVARGAGRLALRGAKGLAKSKVVRGAATGTGVALGTRYAHGRGARSIDRRLDARDHRKRQKMGIRSPHAPVHHVKHTPPRGGVLRRKKKSY
jgi:hypothetical protein